MVAMCVDGREGSWRDTFDEGEGRSSSFEADGQAAKRQRDSPTLTLKANALSSVLSGIWTATSGQLNKDFLANGAMEPQALRAASTARLSGRRPRLAARLVVALPHARHAAPVGVTMVETLKGPKKSRPALLIRRGRLVCRQCRRTMLHRT